MSLRPLENPLNRLALFPTTMNYRGGWAATEQYYANDVVISPIDNKTYILTGRMTLLDGGDPSTNIDWEAISSIGLQSVTAEQATGIWNIGTPQNVVLVNSGVITLQTDAIDGIQNTSTDPQRQTLVNTGVLSMTTEPGSGIGISGTTNKVISNTGVLTVSATGNCVNVGSPTAPVIEATGLVASCAAEPAPLNGGMDVSGTSNPLFSWAPLATGTVSITFPAVTAEVTTPYTITTNSVILVVGYGDFINPFTGGSTPSWETTIDPHTFMIQCSRNGLLPVRVKWALMSV